MAEPADIAAASAAKCSHEITEALEKHGCYLKVCVNSGTLFAARDWFAPNGLNKGYNQAENQIVNPQHFGPVLGE